MLVIGKGKLSGENQADAEIGASMDSQPDKLQKIRNWIVVECTNDGYNAWVQTQNSHPDIRIGLVKMRSINQECQQRIPLSNSGTEVLGLDGVPTNRPGQWEIVARSSNAKKIQQHSSICIDVKTSEALRDVSKQLTDIFSCPKAEHHLVGNEVTTDVVCKMGESTLSKHSVTTFFGDTAYHEETAMHIAPPLVGASDSTKVTDAYWSGPCKQGVQPGDLVTAEGKRFNINGLIKTDQPSTSPDNAPSDSPMHREITPDSVITPVPATTKTADKSYYGISVAVCDKTCWKKTYGLSAFIQQRKIEWLESGKNYPKTDLSENDREFAKSFPIVYENNSHYVGYMPQVITDLVPSSEGDSRIWRLSKSDSGLDWLIDPSSREHSTAFLMYKNSRIDMPVSFGSQQKIFYDPEQDAIVHFYVNRTSLWMIKQTCTHEGKRTVVKPDGVRCVQ